MSRQVMRDCGAPWNMSTGGPEPPITALISAPDVLILSLRKLGGKRRFHAGSFGAFPVVDVSSAAFASAAAPEARTARCNNRRRVELPAFSFIDESPSGVYVVARFSI